MLNRNADQDWEDGWGIVASVGQTVRELQMEHGPTCLDRYGATMSLSAAVMTARSMGVLPPDVPLDLISMDAVQMWGLTFVVVADDVPWYRIMVRTDGGIF